MLDNEVIPGPGIVFERVSLKYGRTEILQNLSFTLDAGLVHCLIGPNGGGKTIALRSLLGETAFSGRIALEWSSEDRGIGYVPQLLNFDYNLPINVLDLLMILTDNRPAFFNPSKSRMRIYDEILDKVGMLEKSRRLMGELSGGERQRILLAQAILPQPQLLILDEPTTGLDREGAEVFDHIIADLRAAGTTILWVHHDLRDVRERADTVTCINKSVLFSGDPQELLTEERILDIFSAMPGVRE